MTFKLLNRGNVAERNVRRKLNIKSARRLCVKFLKKTLLFYMDIASLFTKLQYREVTIRFKYRKYILINPLVFESILTMFVQ